MKSPCSLGTMPTSVTTSSASCASTCPRSWALLHEDPAGVGRFGLHFS